MSQDYLAGLRVGISVSNSANMGELGFGQEHVDDVMVELTRYLMAAGATVVYGGDLRQGGFTELLIEVVARHVAEDDATVRFENFMAWPVHAIIPYLDLVNLIELFAPSGKLVCLTPAGDEMPMAERAKFDRLEIGEDEWGSSLTAMRRMLAARCDARVVAGGATVKYRGAMPGVAEEAFLSVEAGKPTYVTGCLGGCALDIAVEAGLGTSPLAPSPVWPGRALFSARAGEFNRGLAPLDAAALASVPHSTDMLVLLFKGLNAALSTPRPIQG